MSPALFKCVSGSSGSRHPLKKNQMLMPAGLVRGKVLVVCVPPWFIRSLYNLCLFIDEIVRERKDRDEASPDSKAICSWM